ncbi:hypothetical protein [Paenibacillus sp. YYML68]|uniref:hypothetical protein n=1 Tax=Paenibacillus sp. YYML68 TaxID=2909250 RepID=UPI0024939FB2|nr:hypothetical protein [Paenibacillus sp. YYML68]
MMKELQVIHKGKVYVGHVSFEGHELMELFLEQPSTFATGESVICFNQQERAQMRVLRTTENKLLLVPGDSELFRIAARLKGELQSELDLLLEDPTKPVQSMELNSYGTLNDDFKTMPVRYCAVSRFGFSFEVNDFSVRMNHPYYSMIICGDEAIHPRLIVRYAHIKENTIRYGAEIQAISDRDLQKLQLHLVGRQFMSKS